MAVDILTAPMRGPAPDAADSDFRRPLPPLTVVTRGWPWFDRAAVLTMVGFFPVLTGMFYFLAIGGFPDGVVGSIVAAAGVCGSVFLLFEAMTHVRSIEITEAGVTFRYPFHSEYGAWGDLAPGPFPVSHGEWAIVRRRAGKLRAGQERGHRVTVEQARVLLSHPACPRWALPEPVCRQLLGPLGTTPR